MPDQQQNAEPQTDAEIGYILKAFGRTSETFITNEIYLLEQLGLRLSIFSTKQLAEQQNHAVIERIRSDVTWLPGGGSVTRTSFTGWLRTVLPRFALSHLRLFIRRPHAYCRTLAEAVRFCFRYRSDAGPQKAFIREFLQAGFIALRVLESGRIGHLHAHFAHSSATIAMWASRLCGVPFSFTAHAKDIYLRELNPGDLLPLKMSRAKMVVTCTAANQQYLAGIAPPGTRIHTIYHGLNTDLFSPASGHGGNGRNTPLILSAGRHVRKKGFPHLIEACRLLRDRGWSFDCRIVGGADKHTEAIKKRIAELQLQDTITLQPAVTQEELRDIYLQATVFVLPCLVVEDGDRDGIPNVLVEAMAMKRPVISTNISGIPELIEPRGNGLLVPERDVAALAAAIEELLSDASLRERLGEAARAKVCRDFDAQRNTVALRDLFLACLKKR